MRVYWRNAVQHPIGAGMQKLIPTHLSVQLHQLSAVLKPEVQQSLCKYT